MEDRMNRYMRDHMENNMGMGGRDGRNPYGSRGGYVTSRRPRGRDRGSYEGTFRGQTDRRMYDDRTMYDRGMNDRYDRMHDMYDENMSGMDFAAQRVLSNQELDEWKRDLMSHINDTSKGLFTDAAIIRKATEMGVMFDKYTEAELIVTTLMLYTDYCKVIGKGNFDKYIKLADAFLCDEDAAVFGGEKLAMYHDCIVMGE